MAGASSVPTRRARLHCHTCASSLCGGLGAVSPSPPTLFCLPFEGTLNLSKIPASRDLSAHAGCAWVGAACGLKVAAVTWLQRGAVLLLPLPPPPSSPSYPSVMPSSPPPAHHIQPVIRSDSIPNANVNNYKVWKKTLRSFPERFYTVLYTTGMTNVERVKLFTFNQD